MTQEIQRALGRIEGKLDLALPVLRSQETRISKLEKWQSKLLGGALVGGFVLGLVLRALHI